MCENTRLFLAFLYTADTTESFRAEIHLMLRRFNPTHLPRMLEWVFRGFHHYYSRKRSVLAIQ